LKGLNRKVAVVTGGGQGIGRGLTLRLAEEGCKVAVFDINPQGGEETAKLARRPHQDLCGGCRGRRPPSTRGSQRWRPSSVDLAPDQPMPAGPPTPFLKTDKDLWDKIIRIKPLRPAQHPQGVAPLMANAARVASSYRL